jgi:Galactose oxidase, central domain/Kelch motif
VTICRRYSPLKWTLAAWVLTLLAAVQAAPAAPRWQELSTAGPKPPARADHGLAAISPRAVYLFGGRARGRSLGDLWRLDPRRARWERLSPGGPAPRARFGHNFVAEPGGTLLLFGGQAGSGFFADVWRYSPAQNSWTPVAASGPAPRYGAGAAIDPAGGALHVTHGFTDEGRFDDTWTLSGDGFSDTSGLGTRPLERCLVQSAFHEGGLYLFGGQSDSRPYLDDLWRLDLATRTWRELSPARRPAARSLYAAARAGGRWLVHGGQERGGVRGDLWSLDLDEGEFRRLRPRGRRPRPRSSHAAAALGPRRVVVFGGAGATGARNDAWLLRR